MSVPPWAVMPSADKKYVITMLLMTKVKPLNDNWWPTKIVFEGVKEGGGPGYMRHKSIFL